MSTTDPSEPKAPPVDPVAYGLKMQTLSLTAVLTMLVTQVTPMQAASEAMKIYSAIEKLEAEQQ